MKTKNINAYYNSKLKQNYRKQSSAKYLLPVLVAVLPFFLHLTIYFNSINIFIFWGMMFLTFPIINLIFTVKTTQIRYKCWYSEVIFKEDVLFIYVIMVTSIFAVIATFVPIYLIYGFMPPSFMIFMMCLFIVAFFFLVPIVKRKNKRIKKSIARRYKQKLEELEIIIIKSLDREQISYEETKNANTFWENKTTKYSLQNSTLTIKVEYGRIRFDPVTKNNRKIFNRLRKLIDTPFVD